MGGALSLNVVTMIELMVAIRPSSSYETSNLINLNISDAQWFDISCEGILLFQCLTTLNPTIFNMI